MTKHQRHGGSLNVATKVCWLERLSLVVKTIQLCDPIQHCALSPISEQTIQSSHQRKYFLCGKSFVLNQIDHDKSRLNYRPMEMCATPKHEKEDDVAEVAKEKEADESSPAKDSTTDELPAAEKPTEESTTPLKESTEATTEGSKETDPEAPNVSGNYHIL